MGRIIVVTGACGGLGKEFISQYVSSGDTVIGVDINTFPRNEDKRLFFFRCDLTNLEETNRLVEDIFEKFGAPDIWINNAGLVNQELFANESVVENQKVMQINYDAPMRLMKKLIPLMELVDKNCKIVNICSVAGLISAPILSSYCASKFALVGLTESVQQELELRSSSVQLVLVCPGFIETEMIKLGEEKGFPSKLRPFLSSPDNAVRKIIDGINKDDIFIDPTINGKILKVINRFGPELLKKAKRFAVPKYFIKK